ncbi:TM2 domain-containing protein [Micromonospora sp. WMMD1128]|uniref:TM2 domain-containing protein n=1 Tax=unclassified Micromonospora TaxID=2617518 RepID=UPI00248BD67A|nr:MULTISPECIES: TM2 domain-containing protein [unclassified Micromonospora]WBB71469.1 TM2 domain-containing protein [Micromonospora sp. WMMD1128]WFE36630.1 TM2 domain-containing protein [Micromonospora sp. WMMD975]
MDRAGRWSGPQPTGQTSVDIFPPGGRRGGQDDSGSLWCPLMTTPYQQYPQYPQGVSDKSKVVAGILQILLGGFGIGRFYMGDTKTGVIQLVVTLVTCGFGAIWGLVDGILILVNGGVDGQGRPLRD